MRLRRKLSGLNEAIEALDEKLKQAKGDKSLAFSRLNKAELEFVTEEIASCISSRIYYLENYHVVQPENGILSTLYPIWDLQWLIENAIQAERERTGQSKVIVLKPRQCGGTEYANGVMCHATFFCPRAYTLTVAQSVETAAHVQRKVNIAWDHLPYWLRPDRQYHSAGSYMEFQRKDEYERQMDPGLGSVFVTTHAERSAGVAIGKSIRFFHGTEVSRWASGEIYTADIEPSMNALDTLAIMESASLDDRGFYRAMWDEAVENMGTPSQDWIPVFLPVYRARKFSLPIKANVKFVRTEQEEAARLRVLAEENVVVRDEFFNWRRRRVAASIKRTGGPHAHYAAYPMTPQEAFQSTGLGAFPRHKLDYQEQTYVRRPRKVGEIIFKGVGAVHTLALEDPPQILQKRGDAGTSRLWLWEENDPTATYYIAADTSLGNRGDYSAAQVFRAGRGNIPDVQVAEWHGWIPPTDWAKTLYALGTYYNKAEIAVEYASEGMTTANYLFNDLEYPNLYRPRALDRPGGKPMVYLHWTTSMKTKPLIVAMLVEALLEGSIRIRSQLLIDELRKFRVASVSAQGHVSYSGIDSPDDAAMAALICLYCLRQTLPELRSPGYADDASQGSPSRGARASGGGYVYTIHDEWTRIRAQEANLAKAQEIVAAHPGWTIRQIPVSRVNTAYSVIHHGRGAEGQMYRSGIDSREITPAAVQAWRGAKAPAVEEAPDYVDWNSDDATVGGWQGE